MNDPLVLVVEDDPPLRRFLHTTLSSQSFRTVEVGTLKDALIAATMHTPDLVLLDLGLPDGDGLDFVVEVRLWSSVPIIVLSARGREDDKVKALDCGADDYLTKPFGTSELLARIRVALRHAANAGTEQHEITVGPLTVDLVRRTVTIDDVEVHLTPIEWRLLVVLAKNEGKVVTHRQLLKEVWGPRHGGETHYVRVYCATLRRKLERDPVRPRLILTEPGVGYRLRWIGGSAE